MKAIKSAVFGVCLFTSVSVQAQQPGDTTTNSTLPVIVKDPAQQSENQKEQYKSKEWRQGIERVTDTTKASGDKLQSKMRTKAQKQNPVPPPPPPPPPAQPPANPQK